MATNPDEIPPEARCRNCGAVVLDEDGRARERCGNCRRPTTPPAAEAPGVWDEVEGAVGVAVHEDDGEPN